MYSPDQVEVLVTARSTPSTRAGTPGTPWNRDTSALREQGSPNYCSGDEWRSVSSRRSRPAQANAQLSRQLRRALPLRLHRRRSCPDLRHRVRGSARHRSSRTLIPTAWTHISSSASPGGAASPRSDPSAGDNGTVRDAQPDDAVVESVATYSEHVDEYDATHRPKMAEQVERFARSLRTPALILDAGCGPGRDLARFTSMGHVPRGIDLNPDFVAMARRMHRRRAPICEGSDRCSRRATSTASGPVHPLST